MASIKVFHVVESLGGGVFSYFKSLACFFKADSEIEITIIYSDNRKEINPEEIRSVFPGTIALKRLPMEAEIRPLKDSKALRDLIRILNEEKPEIIHLHSSKAGALGRVAGLFLSYTPLIFYTPHGYSFLRRDISALKRNVFKSVEWLLPKISKSVTIACGDTEYLHSGKLGKALLVRNGIDLSSLRKHISPRKTDTLTLGILGRITFARNPEFINLLARKIPETKILWIGDGELRAVLTEPNIEITGWFTNSEEGWKHLNRVDIYIQPSLWEGLPISVIEAMAFEKPVIATNIVGNKDIVVHGETGYLYEDMEGFLGFLNKLKDKDLRMTMGKNARARVDTMFNVSNNFAELKSIYLNSMTNGDS